MTDLLPDFIFNDVLGCGDLLDSGSIPLPPFDDEVQDEMRDPSSLQPHNGQAVSSQSTGKSLFSSDSCGIAVEEHDVCDNIGT